MSRNLVRVSLVGLVLLAVLVVAPTTPPVPVAGDAQLAEPAYRWPLDGEPQVTRRFEPPAQRWLPGHRGVDLASEPGVVVRAAGAGTVFFAGSVAGTGVVSVQHANGLRTTYQPLVPVVAAGDRVAAGDPIGELVAGHAGCPVLACLHWGLRRDELYLDPLSLLGLGQVRLLPRAIGRQRGAAEQAERSSGRNLETAEADGATPIRGNSGLPDLALLEVGWQHGRQRP